MNSFIYLGIYFALRLSWRNYIAQALKFFWAEIIEVMLCKVSVGVWSSYCLYSGLDPKVWGVS